MTTATTNEMVEDAFDAHAFSADFRKGFETLPASRRFTPEQLEVIYGMAYAHAQQRQWDKALPIFAFLSQYGPTRRHYLAGLAQCMRELGRHEDAKNLYSLMLMLFPDHPEPLLYIAECQIAQGDRATAQTTLSELRDILAESSPPHPLQARVQALLARLGTNAPQAAA
ncbi:MAG: SycD/LcrH family type III secretion system chaperone [Ottowia sp.]|uniref:SycD/LcrH family type III secretion system chaperone n=1 Tax=unclassified Ottowia TaxID=2645081 RepID=UPI003C306561